MIRNMQPAFFIFLEKYEDRFPVRTCNARNKNRRPVVAGKVRNREGTVTADYEREILHDGRKDT